MQEFIDLIQTAFFAQENQKRSFAEQNLVNIKQQNTSEFFSKCSTVFISSQLDSQLRVAAGTLLKRCIYFELGWLKVSLEVKQRIKTELLSLLISSDQNIKRSAANCISGICAIELPRKEWPEIVSILVQNTAHEQIEIKKAAIITLGYICEALKNQKQSIDKNESEKVLYGISQGFQGDKEIRLISLRALQDCLPFMDIVLSQQNVRDHVTKLLMESIFSTDSEIKLRSLQCLIDYSKAVFEYLDQYITAFWNCTVESLQNKEFAIAAMEVWQSIASEANERATASNRTNQQFQKNQKDALRSIQQQLLQAVLSNLIVVEDEDEDDEEQSIQEAAYKAAQSISEALGNSCYMIFLAFIESKYNSILDTHQSPDWQHRKASLLAFSAMVETPDIVELQNYSNSVIGEFIKKLIDPHKQVQLAASRVITRIAENYPFVLLKHTQLDEIIKNFASLLQSNTKTTKYMLWTLVHLTEAFKDDENNTFTKYFDFLISQFAFVTTRVDISDPTLIDVAWVGILNCLQCIQDIGQIKQYLGVFGQQMTTIFQQGQWKRDAMICGLLSAIHTGFLRLNVLKDTPDLTLMTSHYQVIIDFFKKAQTVTNDGFYAVSAIAQYGKRNFQQLAQEFIQNYLQVGLQKQLEPETFKGAVLCLADIARALLEGFKPYVTILDYLIKCVNEPQTHRLVKISLFTCISDIVLATGFACESYFQQIWQLLLSGFQASISFTQNRDLSQLEYYENLNETLLNSYMCLLHAFNEESKPYLPMFQTISDLFLFIQATTEKSLTPTVDYIRTCIVCLIDCINYYKLMQGSAEILIGLARSPLLQGLLEMLYNYSAAQENKEILQYAQQQLKSYNIHVRVD